MPGRPKQRADLIKLEGIGREKVEDMLERGMSVTGICNELGIGKHALYEFFEKAENAGILSRARARAADRLAIETLEIADSVPEEQTAIAKAKLRTDVRKWVASKWDPLKYGDTKGPNIQINVGDLHLNALRKVGTYVPETVDQVVDDKEE